MWLRPVERTVRVREVESSNLSTPTEKSKVRRLPTRGSLFLRKANNGDGAALVDQKPEVQVVGSLDSTARYTQPSEEDLMNAVERLGERM